MLLKSDETREKNKATSCNVIRLNTKTYYKSFRQNEDYRLEVYLLKVFKSSNMKDKYV